MSPIEITQDIETGINIASFNYYDGINVAEERGLEQTTSFHKVNCSTHFVVCCGDVMFRVHPEEYPEISRRIF